jgi:hypothetical protein
MGQQMSKTHFYFPEIPKIPLSWLILTASPLLSFSICIFCFFRSFLFLLPCTSSSVLLPSFHSFSIFLLFRSFLSSSSISSRGLCFLHFYRATPAARIEGCDGCSDAVDGAGQRRWHTGWASDVVWVLWSGSGYGWSGKHDWAGLGSG